MNESDIELEKLLDYSKKDRIVTSNEMRAYLAKFSGRTTKFTTKLPRLDAITNGIETGELIAIGGPTKHGKTLLCQTITSGLAELNIKSLWFTFEVPVRQFLEQMPETVTFLLPMELQPKSLEWVFNRIAEAKIKYDARVVFIDNLHHLLDLSTMRNLSLDIGVIIRRLKSMAIALDVAIFILCHSKKPYESHGMPPEPTEWDLRDSSFIPQECDSTWMIQRKLDKDTKRHTLRSSVKVCNHRRTGAMNEMVHLIKVGNFLVEDETAYEHR